MSRFLTATVVGLLLAGTLALGAMAADDWPFWQRWFARVPAITGFGGNANAIPDLRSDFGGEAAPLTRRQPEPRLVAPLRQADAWMADRNSDAFLVWHDGALVFEHYYRGDAATQRPAGAMAKSLVAIMVGRAIREGAIAGLDAPVADALPEWRNDERNRIRWRDLLAMHAGLAWYRQETSPFSDFQRIIIGSDYQPRALALPAVAPPGEVFDYSAWTYDIAGLALARAGNAPYEDLVDRWLTPPLGLGPMRIYVDRDGGNVHANCCLYGRADDWVRLGALIADEWVAPRLLPDGFVAEMRKPGPDRANYGLGIWLGSPYEARRPIASTRNPYPTPVKSVIEQSEPFAADDVMIFEGVGQTKTWIIPSRRLVIVRFGSAPQDWDDAMVPNLLIRALQ
ncbi:serine hydrolase [Croceicoccus sp. Ery5]|uniref:serine hydrolase domain-containing protein n=1 Tax=Croceicoccus sp. Ery5 TaxID=1703340 RepID=UPI001E40C65C|nr:serine hydrolase domain-containing protein [Croceicoccus sp. Ery5]